MKKLPRFLPLLLASALPFARPLPVAADEPELVKEAQNGDKPDKTEEAPKPAAPEAKVSADAQAVIDAMDRAYEALKSLQLAGTLNLTLEEQGKTRTHDSTFTSLFQSPNRFRHEASDQPVLGSTGKKAYGFSAENNAFSQADLAGADAKAEGKSDSKADAESKLTLDQLPEDHNKILPAQNLSLVLAMTKDPAASLKSLSTEIEKTPDQQIDGKTFTTLKLTRPDPEGTVTVFVDPQTHLIRRTTTDLVPVLAKLGRPDIKTATFTVDYTKTTPDAETKPEQFAWAPPPGAKDLAAIRAAAGGDEDEGGEAMALVGKPAPDFTLPDLDAKDVTLSDLKGSVVLLDFWATWCGPCVASMPHLQKLHDELGKDGGKDALKLYAINLREDKEKVAAFLKKQNLTLPVLLDKEGMSGKQFGVSGIPQTVLIGKDGTIKKVWIGFSPDGAEKMKALIVQEMKAKPASAPLSR